MSAISDRCFTRMPDAEYRCGTLFFDRAPPDQEGAVEIYDNVARRPCWRRGGLAGLPTAHQSPVCVSAGTVLCPQLAQPSRPLSVDRRAGFQRTGSKRHVVQGLRKIDPIVPQPVRSLSTPYLFFSADFNCIHGDDRDLESYLETYGERCSRRSARSFNIARDSKRSIGPTFTAFIKRGQVETTMPFHDYWVEAPKLPSLPCPGWAVAPLSVVSASRWICSICSLIFHGHVLLAFTDHRRGHLTFGLYKFVMVRGAAPFRRHRRDLPGVLKSLYLQKEFTRFAIETRARSRRASRGFRRLSENPSARPCRVANAGARHHRRVKEKIMSIDSTSQISRATSLQPMAMRISQRTFHPLARQ